MAMPYEPLTAERFGGLELNNDPSEIGFAGAVTVGNVILAPDGSRLQTRPGYDVAAPTIASPTWIAWSEAHGVFVTVGTGTNAIKGIAENGALDFTAGTLASSNHAVSFGVGVTSYMYISTTSGLSRVTLAGVLEAVASSPGAQSLAVKPGSNRMVTGESTIGGTLPSRVHFSNAGDANTWATDNWVDLDPNDGERIRMVISWRELLFAFKQTKFYVFGRESVDSTGGAVFNYRTVDTGVGCVGYRTAVATDDGVYFIHTSGVWKTTGEAPVLVSQVLQPYFSGQSTGVFTATSPSFAVVTDNVPAWIHADQELLYVGSKNGAGMFVMDKRSGLWSHWLLAAGVACMAPMPASPMVLSKPSRAFVFIDSASPGTIGVFGVDLTTGLVYADDDGTAIASHYQTGFQQLAEGKSARVRRFELTGSGTVTHTLYGDHVTAAEWNGKAAASVVMGTSPAVAKAYAQQSGRARDLAFKVSATSGAWSLSRWAALVADVRSY